MRHFLKATLPFYLLPHQTEILGKNVHLNPYQKGLITTIYELILKLPIDIFDKIKNDWERGLQISLPIEKWERILQLVNTCSCVQDML